MDYVITPEKFMEYVRQLYTEARAIKRPHPIEAKDADIFRGRNHSISGALEDLLAWFISQNNPNRCRYFTDQPMKFGKSTRYPDIVIQTESERINHLIDVKADLGWNRNGLYKFCESWNERILEVRGTPTSFKKGENKEDCKGEFTESLKYHVVIITDTNADAKKLRDDIKEVEEKLKGVEVYILSNGLHPNNYFMNGETPNKEMEIRTDEFDRLISAVVV